MSYRVVVWSERLGRWALAVIFLAAAIPKVLDPSGFAADISHYALLPDVFVNPLAVILPWVEAVGALALLSGFAAEGAILLINALLVVFLGAMGQAFFRGLDINCGCFGHSAARETVGMAMVRDLAFMALAGLVLWLRAKRTGTKKIRI